MEALELEVALFTFAKLNLTSAAIQNFRMVGVVMRWSRDAPET